MKKYLYFRKSNNKLEMVSEGINRYDQNIFYLEIMDLTEPKLQEIFNAQESFLENKKLRIEPKIDKAKQKKDLELEIDKATDFNQIKVAIKKLIQL